MRPLNNVEENKRRIEREQHHAMVDRNRIRNCTKLEHDDLVFSVRGEYCVRARHVASDAGVDGRGHHARRSGGRLRGRRRGDGRLRAVLGTRDRVGPSAAVALTPTPTFHSAL